MKPIETPQQMIEYLKLCESQSVTEVTKSYYRKIREWLEKLIRMESEATRHEKETSKLHEKISNLQLVLSKCGVGYKL